MRSNLLALLLSGLLGQSAYAAHPLVTDDTNTQDQGNSQIEANTDRVRQTGGYSSVGTLTYSYGATGNLDVYVNTPMTFSSPSDINDAALGVKWRFIETDVASMALKSELLLPTGNENKDLGNGRTSMSMTLIGSYDAAPWTLHGNLAVTFNRYALQSQRDENRSLVWRMSAAAWYALNEKWRLVTDIGIARNIEKNSDAHPGYLVLGAIYSPRDNLDLDAGWRMGLGCGECAAQIKRQFGVGLTWRF